MKAGGHAGRHAWDLGNGCSVCGCERREVTRPSKYPAHGDVEVTEYSMDDGRTWSETRPPCVEPPPRWTCKEPGCGKPTPYTDWTLCEEHASARKLPGGSA